MNFLSLAALEVVKMTNSDVGSDENLIKKYAISVSVWTKYGPI